jgi:NADPH:quinone reductase-like Zn-dependent oxidoreductase
MKGVRLYEHGDPTVLRYDDVPVPDIGPGDVLVKVHATALNHWDLRYSLRWLRPVA